MYVGMYLRIYVCIYTAYFRSIQPDYAHILSRPGLMVSATLYGVKLDVLSVSFSVRVFLTSGPRGYSSSVPCIGATGRKRANTGSTRSLPVRRTALDHFQGSPW